MVAVEKWKEDIEAKVTMRWYKKNHCLRKEMHDGSWGSVLWFRARTDSLEVNGRTHHWEGREDTCRVCELGVRESMEYDSRYEKERTCLRESIENKTGIRVEEMNRENQMCLILGFQERKQEVMEAVRSF